MMKTHIAKGVIQRIGFPAHIYCSTNYQKEKSTITYDDNCYHFSI